MIQITDYVFLLHKEIRQRVIPTKQSPSPLMDYYKHIWTADIDIEHAKDVLKTSYHFFTRIDEDVSLSIHVQHLCNFVCNRR